MKRKSKNKINKELKKVLYSIVISLIALLIIYIENDIRDFLNRTYAGEENQTIGSYTIEDIPKYSGDPYLIIDDNIPKFPEEDFDKEFETYSELDYLGRCGVAYANISRKTMPAYGVERESISSVYPSGWNNKPYKGLVEGDFLYNRCHLIGWQLGAENDNELNLITGTRYMNVIGMLPFENKIADYLHEKINKKNHVLYRVTPIYEKDNLVASGVQMEAFSVEDSGEGVCFNVYVYNVQPGIKIDYSNGNSKIAEE